MKQLFKLKSILVGLLLCILILQAIWIFKAYQERSLHLDVHLKNAVNHGFDQYCRDGSCINEDKPEVLKAYISDELSRLNESISFNIKIIDNEYKTTERVDKSINYYSVLCQRGNKQQTVVIITQSTSLYILGSVILWIALSAIFLVLLVLFTRAYFHNLSSQKELHKLKNEFISNMTHELKTPISTISVASEILQNNKIHEEQDKIARYSGIIYEENNRLKRLVDRVMQVVIFEKGELELELSEFDIHELIKLSCKPLALIANKRKGGIELNLNASEHIAKVDRTHFTSVISNLIENAIKYSDDTPMVSLTTKNEGSKLVIEVSDNGIGIPVKDQKRVFEKYYRTSETNKSQKTGFGLGLFYVYQVIKAHHAEISVKSKVGIGSTFSIKLLV